MHQAIDKVVLVDTVLPFPSCLHLEFALARALSSLISPIVFRLTDLCLANGLTDHDMSRPSGCRIIALAPQSQCELIIKSSEPPIIKARTEYTAVLVRNTPNEIILAVNKEGHWSRIGRKDHKQSFATSHQNHGAGLDHTSQVVEHCNLGESAHSDRPVFR